MSDQEAMVWARAYAADLIAERVSQSAGQQPRYVIARDCADEAVVQFRQARAALMAADEAMDGEGRS